MREISEYKLLGYYLIKIYEKTGLDYLKIEQVKFLSDSIFKKMNSANYIFLPIENKSAIVKNMINRGMFKTTNINGKQSFTQIHNYEISKFIYVYYNCDGDLTFKLPKEIKENKFNNINKYKSIYENFSLDLLSVINSELNNYCLKLYTKNRSIS